MARWVKGKSGNPRGRPKSRITIADLARTQIEKHKLVEKLGRIGAGRGDCGKVEIDQQLRAIQLLLAYGYGPPRPEVAGAEGIVIQVTYVERNQIAITSAPSGASPSDSGSQALQCGLLRAPLGQDSPRDGSTDPSSTAG
jgi:hypothetical protein